MPCYLDNSKNILLTTTPLRIAQCVGGYMIVNFFITMYPPTHCPMRGGYMIVKILSRKVHIFNKYHLFLSLEIKIENCSGFWLRFFWKVCSFFSRYIIQLEPFQVPVSQYSSFRLVQTLKWWKNLFFKL